MIYVAFAILGGLLALALVAYLLGSRWLTLQQKDREDEEEIDYADPVQAIRKGPGAQARAEAKRWRAEMKAQGLSDAEIDRRLDDREPVAWV